MFCIAITFGFGEKRCRKNLPLADTINRMDTIEHAGRHIEIGSFHILGPAVQLPTEPNRIQSTIERIPVSYTHLTLPTKA